MSTAVRLPDSVAVVAPSPVPLRRGGAERLWDGTVDALRSAGVAVDLVKLPVREHTLPDLLDAYEQFALLDLSHVDAVITGKYPAWMVDHPTHVVWMLHPLRGLYDSYRPAAFEGRRLPDDPDLVALTRLLAEGPRRADPFEVMDRARAAADRLGPAASAPDGALSLPGPLSRAVVQFLDRWALEGRRIRRHAAISGVVAGRPDYFPPEVAVEVVHPPASFPGADRLHPPGRDLLVVSRLERIKRVDLAIEAFRRVEVADATLTIVGEGPDRHRLEDLAGDDGRISFTGRIDDDGLAARYLAAAAVVVTPEREDLGLVTLEARRFGRGVITTTDAGGPTELVGDGADGLVTEPDPRAVAAAMTAVLDGAGTTSAERLAEAAWARRSEHDWADVPAALLGTAAPPRRTAGTSGRGRLVAVSTYPVAGWPGGGAERARHLLGALARDGWQVDLVDLATEDGPAGEHRSPAPGVAETTVTVSARQHEAEARLRLLTGNVSITDIAASQLWPATPALVRELVAALDGARAAVLVQPYLYPAVRTLAPRLPVVLDAHNHEGALKAGLLPANEGGRWLLDRVHAVEGAACQAARLITVVTSEDRTALATDHSLDPDRVAVVPNGVDTRAVRFTDTTERAGRRDALLRRLGAGPSVRHLALFVGSGHAPNIEAGRAIADMAPELGEFLFVLAGRHSSFLNSRRLPGNVRLLGTLDDEQLSEVQAAADVGLNPMQSGGGSNLKLLGYFAAGLPVVSTRVGARGVDHAERYVRLAELGEFPAAIRAAVGAPEPERARAARRLVEEHFEWTVLGDRFAGLVREVLAP
ncbi:MAG: glycosyltransferase [Microthrixaceae bacterium]